MPSLVTKQDISVLIIEDNEDYLEYTQMILSRVSDQYIFYMASTMSAAINILVSEYIDVVISDLDLPDSQGLESVKKIKTIDSEIPIILLTNLDDHELGVQAINAGAADYISKKNVSAPLLHRMIIHAIERNRILKELEEKKHQVLRMQKMESLVTLVGGISHDFNNIITLIQGYSELIDGYPEIPDKIDQYNTQIGEASRRAADLIVQFSTFSQVESRKTQIIDVNVYIQSLQEMLQTISRADVEIKLELENKNPTIISINPTNFEQIIVNLVLNAREAIEANGVITIRTRVLDSCLKCDITDPVVNITVEDNGIGIPKEDLDSIYDPYFTTKQTGSGLGLATVFGLVNQVNGCIDVNSEVGVGTIVNMCFPTATDMKKSREITAVSTIDQKQLEETNILIIDDDTEILELLKSILEGEGYVVTVSSDPLGVLDQIVSAKVCPSVILTDVIMPKISGIEFAKKVQSHFPNIPILLMSGYSPQYYKNYDNYNFELIRKPFNKTDLITKLSKSLIS